jgi:hypothetical protein
MAEVIITWKTWTGLMQKMRRHGWSPCNFAIRTTDGENAQFVYGAVYGVFGIYQTTGTIKNVTVTGGLELNQNVDISFAVHLPSGTRVAIFSDLAEAMEGMELANRVREWHEMLDDEDLRWNYASQCVADMWIQMGLVTDEAMSAEIPGMDCANRGIVHRMPEVAEYGKPRRLS